VGARCTWRTRRSTRTFELPYPVPSRLRPRRRPPDRVVDPGAWSEVYLRWMTDYRISELAALVGLPPTTLSFYDRVGLLPARRSSGGSGSMTTTRSVGCTSYQQASTSACPCRRSATSSVRWKGACAQRSTIGCGPLCPRDWRRRGSSWRRWRRSAHAWLTRSQAWTVHHANVTMGLPRASASRQLPSSIGSAPRRCRRTTCRRLSMSRSRARFSSGDAADSCSDGVSARRDRRVAPVW
jgi:hypothetical protein